MILYAALLACAVLAGRLVYRYDLYNREPWPALLLAAAAGAVAMRLAERIESALMVHHPGDAQAAAIAALVEELLRLALVALIALLFRRTFDDPMDGLVYGSISGLGMGLEESLALLSLLSRAGLDALPGELVRLLGHLVMGGVTGFGVGLARMRTPGWPSALAASVTTSVALHFLWDRVALWAPASAAALALQSLLAVIVMLAGLLLYGALVVKGSALSRGVFAPLSTRSLWGWPFDVARGRAPGASGAQTPRGNLTRPR